MGYSVIEDEKIYLGNLKDEDLEKICYWRNNLEKTKNLCGFRIGGYIFSDIKQWHEKKKENDIRFGIYLKKNDELVGHIGLYQINWINKNAEFGIFIGEEKHRDKKIGQRALRLILAYAFKYLNLEKIYLTVMSMNTAAIKLYEKFNFKKEGLFKKEIYRESEYIDVLRMALFKEDFLKLADKQPSKYRYQP